MSRLRMSRVERMLRKELDADECSHWPECACAKNLEKYQERLASEEIFSFEQIEAMEEVIYCTLACVERYCPDGKIKSYAGVQLRLLEQRRRRIAVVKELAGMRAQ